MADVDDDTVYVGADRLRALDATTGDERWHATVDGGPILSATVVDESGSSEAHSVFTHGDGGHLAVFDSDGERTWTASVSGEIETYRVGESVIVATEKSIYGLDR